MQARQLPLFYSIAVANAVFVLLAKQMGFTDKINSKVFVAIYIVININGLSNKAA